MTEEAYSPDSVTMSKMRPYSMGVVAQNKDLSSNFIDVFPVEDLNMANGEITGDTKEINAKGKTSSGASYNSTVRAKVTIKAEWMPVGGGNRITSPDVRRGTVVQLYQFGDSSDHYYWTTLKQDIHLRKLETVIYAFSGTTKEADKTDGSNSYFLEISTHKKLVTFHTSKSNNEKYSYDIQINTGEGKIIITDDVGNLFVLDSNQSRLFMKNSQNTSVDISRDSITMTSGKNIKVASKSVEIIAPNGIILNGPVAGSGGGKFEGAVETKELKTININASGTIKGSNIVEG